MARLKFGFAWSAIGLALLLLGCERSEQKTSQAEPAKPEPAPAPVTVAEMTDDELCAWMCGNCFREYAGLLEYPGDCRGKCKEQITTNPCAEPMRDKVLCQVRNGACDACAEEEQAAVQCLRECSKIRREQGEENLPEHCKVKTPQP